MRRPDARHASASARWAVVVAAVLAVALTASGPATGPRGTVRLFQPTGPSFDAYTTNATPRFQAWMRTHAWRALTYSPYFDDKTRWYRNAWVYQDLYAIYRGSDVAREHRRWILRDAAGRPLSIPWACRPGPCPQFAANPADPAFRRWWIARARAALRHGYRGLWIDDVNLDPRIADRLGRPATAVDPRTRRPITAERWRAAIAGFVVQIRRALPGIEIAHNVIWYAGGPERDADPQVRRALAAASFVNLEHGVTDDGLAGDGPFSLPALLAYIDRRHAEGQGVILGGAHAGRASREYALAGYFLISNGHDAIALKGVTPRTWWPMLDVRLGRAAGPRTSWMGLLRRDFAAGMVLVNPPGGPTRRVVLPARMRDSHGRRVTSVTLRPRQGAVLRRR